jgi:hypothetical protein
MAAALPKGTKVGTKHGFHNHLHNHLHDALLFSVGSSPADNWYFGPWLNLRKPAYLGLKFTIKGEVHYGWARLGDIRPRRRVRALLTGSAYETIPDKAIVALPRGR